MNTTAKSPVEVNPTRWVVKVDGINMGAIERKKSFYRCVVRDKTGKIIKDFNKPEFDQATYAIIEYYDKLNN